MMPQIAIIIILIVIVTYSESVTKQMLTYYNQLRQKYIIDGFSQACQYIQQLQLTDSLPQKLLANFYCYITIQAQFKADQILQILDGCLSSADCVGSLRALTLYHKASVYFKSAQYEPCRQFCQQILQEFIGLYYSIEMRLEKSQKQLEMNEQLQQIIYYAFLMLAYVSRKQNKVNDSNVLLEAGRRIIKDRADVFSLTTKTTITKSQPSDEFKSPPSSQLSPYNNSQKQNIKIETKPFLKHTRSLNTS